MIDPQTHTPQPHSTTTTRLPFYLFARTTAGGVVYDLYDRPRGNEEQGTRVTLFGIQSRPLALSAFLFANNEYLEQGQVGFEDVRSLARVAGFRLLTNEDGFALHPIGDFTGLEAFTHTTAGYVCAIRWLVNGRDTCPLEEEGSR